MSAASVTLRYLLLADDKASDHLRRTGDEAERAGKKVGGMSHVMTGLKIAGAAAGAGLLAVFKTGIDEASDAAAGTAQLAAGIKSTGNAAHVTVGGLNNLAGSIQSYSGQTDDSIVASEKLLLTFTNIHNQTGKNNDIFNQATQATADMAAKMGGDASKYSVQLGKALNDPIKGVTALQKIGVSFTDGQKKQITALVKSGDSMKAQKIILGELNKEFGGSAKAAGQTLPGQLARSKRAFEDVAQGVVTQLMPIITALANFLLTKVMPAFKAVTDFIMQHKTIFTVLAVVIGTVVAGLKLWSIAQGILNAVMALNPIAIIVIAIAALVAGVIWIATKTKWFQEIWHAAWGAIKAAFNAVFNFVKDHWKLILAILTGPIGGAVIFITSKWGAIKSGFAGVVNFIGDKVTAIVRFITGIPGRIAGVVGAIGRIGARMGAGLWNGIKGIIGEVGGFGKSLYNAVAQSINWLIDKIKNWHFTVGAFGVHHTFQPFGGIPEIPLMAKGGVVTSPTLAMIGEAGPEAIVPLNRASKYGFGGGGGTNVYITFPPGVVLGTPAEVGKAVGKALEYAGNQGVKLHISKAIV